MRGNKPSARRPSREGLGVIKPLFIYVDVDDTLFRRRDGEGETAIKNVVAHGCDLHRDAAVAVEESDGE